MPKKYRRRREVSLTPAIVLLNVTIVIVIALLIYSIYAFIISEETDRKPVTLPPETEVSEPIDTLTSETTTPPETTTSISMTKAKTTPIKVITEVPEGEVTQAVTQDDNFVPIHSSTKYDANFFDEDLFIGDSIMTGFSGFGYLKKGNVFAKVGLNPESALTTSIDDQTVQQKLTELSPRNIYIMLGTNGLSYMSGSYMAKCMGKLIDSVKDTSPDSRVFVLTIPPVTKAHDEQGSETQDKVDIYNGALSSLAEEKGVRILDINKILSNDEGFMANIYAEVDGLHLKGEAYQVVLSYIQENVE